MSGSKGSVIDVFKTFLKLGLTSFGGPIAHLAYFRKELVEKQQWVDDPVTRKRINNQTLLITGNNFRLILFKITITFVDKDHAFSKRHLEFQPGF